MDEPLLHYYQRCRLCLTEQRVRLHIFGEKARRHKLVKKLEECLSLMVMENDALPKFVCYLCVAKLESFQNFKNECLSVDQILREHLRFVKKKSIEDSEEEHQSSNVTTSSRLCINDRKTDKEYEEELYNDYGIRLKPCFVRIDKLNIPVTARNVYESESSSDSDSSDELNVPAKRVKPLNDCSDPASGAPELNTQQKLSEKETQARLNSATYSNSKQRDGAKVTLPDGYIKKSPSHEEEGADELPYVGYLCSTEHQDSPRKTPHAVPQSDISNSRAVPRSMGSSPLKRGPPPALRIGALMKANAVSGNLQSFIGTSVPPLCAQSQVTSSSPVVAATVPNRSSVIQKVGEDIILQNMLEGKLSKREQRDYWRNQGQLSESQKQIYHNPPPSVENQITLQPLAPDLQSINMDHNPLLQLSPSSFQRQINALTLEPVVVKKPHIEVRKDLQAPFPPQISPPPLCASSVPVQLPRMTAPGASVPNLIGQPQVQTQAQGIVSSVANNPGPTAAGFVGQRVILKQARTGGNPQKVRVFKVVQNSNNLPFAGVPVSMVEHYKAGTGNSVVRNAAADPLNVVMTPVQPVTYAKPVYVQTFTSLNQADNQSVTQTFSVRASEMQGHSLSTSAGNVQSSGSSQSMMQTTPSHFAAVNSESNSYQNAAFPPIPTSTVNSLDSSDLPAEQDATTHFLLADPLQQVNTQVDEYPDVNLDRSACSSPEVLEVSPDIMDVGPITQQPGSSSYAPNILIRDNQSSNSPRIMAELNPQNINNATTSSTKALNPASKGVKLFKICDVCGKTFPDGYKFRAHELTHNTETPFKCEVCGRGFKVHRYLTNHMARCHSESGLACKLCVKSFKSETSYREHQALHAGENTCKICNKAFAQRRNLHIHIQKQHPGQLTLPDINFVDVQDTMCDISEDYEIYI